MPVYAKQHNAFLATVNLSKTPCDGLCDALIRGGARGTSCLRVVADVKEFLGSIAADSAARLPGGYRDRLLRRMVFSRLRGLEQGRLTVVDSAGSTTFGAYSEAFPLQATVTVHDPQLYRRLALRGSIGVGESYMAGEWSCDDLTTLVRIFVLNRAILDGLEKGLVRLAMPIFRPDPEERHRRAWVSAMESGPPDTPARMELFPSSIP